MLTITKSDPWETGSIVRNIRYPIIKKIPSLYCFAKSFKGAIPYILIKKTTHPQVVIERWSSLTSEISQFLTDSHNPGHYRQAISRGGLTLLSQKTGKL